MWKISKFLYIEQEREVKDPFNGEMYKQRRLNPYNPISYMILLLKIFIVMIVFAIIGLWKEIELEDLKWQYK